MVLAVFAVTLDVTVLTVALPTLAGGAAGIGVAAAVVRHGVHAGTGGRDAGQAGLLGDRYGRKLLMSAGLVLFVIGSLGCAYAPSPEVFIAARVALGLAGATVIVMVLSIITVLFHRGGAAASDRHLGGRELHRPARWDRSSVAGCSATSGGAGSSW